jgi:vacuolar iron transporter family protein
LEPSGNLLMRHIERHKAHRIGWLRAAVLGANDGIVSTASLVLGVAAAGASQKNILIAGVAGLMAGAMSMAAGEYVSVSSQSDTENADLERERKELATDPLHEHTEMTDIYIKRGLDKITAAEVATQLMKHDALGAHARDELGITEMMSAKPLQAAFASAATFAIGAVLPLLVTLIVPASALTWAVAASSLFFLALLGSLAARAGGASIKTAAMRVTFWGAMAMALTAGVGALFGVNV